MDMNRNEDEQHEELGDLPQEAPQVQTLFPQGFMVVWMFWGGLGVWLGGWWMDDGEEGKEEEDDGLNTLRMGCTPRRRGGRSSRRRDLTARFVFLFAHRE